ncbi:MAG TPA: hypothetical protein VMH04_24320 [Candidatus Solibacter sp.]|nr:hypothetical protein [Candidatus Solibacter sp.]
MHCFGCRFLIAACLVAGFRTLSAAQTVGLTVDVPFQFNVGETVLPAGHYVILVPEDDAVKLLGQNEMTIKVKANHVSAPPRDGAGMVSFNCYGNRCFLSRFWSPRANIGKELLKSHLEKDIAERGDQLTTIALKAKPYELQ